MSAAMHLPAIWSAGAQPLPKQECPAAKSREKPLAVQDEEANAEPVHDLGFYRGHTQRLLRRYLYAAMQIGRSPSVLGDPVSRGWASSRPIRTFEDAVIFVLDVETCFSRLNSLDREMICRIVLQEYTQAEASTLLGMSARSISYKFPQALDRLTEQLLQAGLLVLPG